MVVLVHHGKLLYLVLLQYVGSSHQVGLLVRRHQVLLRHDFLDGTVQLALKAQVTVGDDAYQMALFVDHGNASDVVFCHDVEGLSHRAAQRDGHGVVYHAVLGTLDDGHLAGLVLYRHVLVNDANATLAGYGNSHLALRHRVHGGCDEGHVELDVARETGSQLYRLGQYLGIGWNQQDVVKSQAVHNNLVCNK